MTRPAQAAIMWLVGLAMTLAGTAAVAWQIGWRPALGLLAVWYGISLMQEARR